MRANQLHPGYCPADPRKHEVLDGLCGTAQLLAGTLRLWRRRRRERREFAEFTRLDPRILADVGLTREGAEFLINKPFWRE